MLTLETQDGIQHHIPEAFARRIPLLKTILESTSSLTAEEEVIPLPALSAKTFRLAVIFLQNDITSPTRLTRIQRPLPTATLVDAGIPEWSDAFIKTVPFGVQLLDLAEAASFLRLNMLEALCCAKVAATIKEGICADMFNVEARLSNEDEAKLKSQNEWAWESPVDDVMLQEEEEENEFARAEAIASLEKFEPKIKDDVKVNESADFMAKGLLEITKDVRIVSSTRSCDSFRLLSPLAGRIALFL